MKINEKFAWSGFFIAQYYLLDPAPDIEYGSGFSLANENLIWICNTALNINNLQPKKRSQYLHIVHIGKKGVLTLVQAHVEAKHLTTGGFYCQECGKFCNTRNALMIHKTRFHQTKISWWTLSPPPPLPLSLSLSWTLLVDWLIWKVSFFSILNAPLWYLGSKNCYPTVINR